MYYVTMKQKPMYHQITLEEFLAGTATESGIISMNTSNTKTWAVERINDKLRDRTDVYSLINQLKRFNYMTSGLRAVDRHSLYSEFYIPKHSGGLRKIDAPNEELKEALRALMQIFSVRFGALYHTSAFAYIKDRSTIECMKRHQNNDSKWYGKTDFSNFFGSTTLEFTMHILSMIYPFCLVCEDAEGKEELRTALELAFLDGGLPQGTPISPMLTNLIMIPIDFKLCNTLRNFNNQRFIYTRYADDIQISSQINFDMNRIVKLIDDTLQEFDAPFRIKQEKTRYGSSAGRNWNLGIMINSKNEMTIGSKKKRQFEAMLHAFTMDALNGKEWNLQDIQVLDGLCNYYRMVEGETIDRIIAHIGNKNNVDIAKLIKKKMREALV